MALYAVTIFLSAFLLFQIQPLIGRYILPWFGGTPGVWTTCLLFFQCTLFLGYLYAHLLSSRLPAKRQRLIHILLLLLALAFLPIAPDPAIWKPDPARSAVWQILVLLTANIGLPMVLISATGPLFQRWFSDEHPDRSPYRLYALSNLASVLSLVTYPILFEPLLRLHTQGWFWSGLFVAFVVSAGLCVRGGWNANLQRNASLPTNENQPTIHPRHRRPAK